MKELMDQLDKEGIDEAIAYLEKKRSEKLGSEASEKMLGPNPFVGLTRRNIFNTAGMAMWQTVKNPKNAIQHSYNFIRESARAITGSSDLVPDPKDRRFGDVAWKDNPFLRAILQTYLAAQKEINGWIDDENIHEYDKDRLKFIASLITDGIAPSNTILNPLAMKRLIETGGKSAVNGAMQLVKDSYSHFGLPSSVDTSAFKVGKNLASTPGSVIYRNDVLELIQYKPQTEKVGKRPMLFIPPQINKFYIFDLSENKSIARFMLSQGLQLFAISWKNPTPDERNWNLTTYINAIESAMEAIFSITGSKDLNVLAGCSGGLTLVTLLGYYAAKQIKTIRSASLVVSVYDVGSTTESEMMLFSDDATIEAARKASARKGVLDGSEMSRVFAWMRPNDLIWNYWVNNYLMGNPPPAFDILYWNQDSTCLPADLHSEFLDMFQHNILVKPGKKKIKDAFIDLGKVECDTFTVGGVTDHICPWPSAYRSSLNLGGNKEFVLSASGHMQCLLNLPGNPKAMYYLNPDFKGNDPKKWFKGAEKHMGSWWEYWGKWILERSGEMKNAPKKLGNKEYPVKCDAPGTYVFE